jgi:hypothetical protein
VPILDQPGLLPVRSSLKDFTARGDCKHSTAYHVPEQGIGTSVRVQPTSICSNPPHAEPFPHAFSRAPPPPRSSP